MKIPNPDSKAIKRIEALIHQAAITELEELQKKHESGAFYSLIIEDRIKELKEIV